ncbi:hypothetical protein SS50377_26511 [Spironucleus salmonicida]|uniref:Uncharacterized protein n=1 Tax=Spironucleus salmonicida TaxID=348837 RepID=V6LAA4_9EUKA|nr:hypothetical protein SS50377_26511 [Spironucleus salmonicida]|eukprot:EST41365.1 Hypothetical protein SS50377_19080 [Spironucleus salmonicida]
MGAAQTKELQSLQYIKSSKTPQNSHLQLNRIRSSILDCEISEYTENINIALVNKENIEQIDICDSFLSQQELSQQSLSYQIPLFYDSNLTNDSFL